MEREARKAPIGGAALVAAAVAFAAVFGYLAARFGYPEVLDGSAAEVLPRLLALGPSGRAVWVAYALIPLLLVPAGVGADAALRPAAPGAARLARILGFVAAASMAIGLARWSTVHWAMAEAWDGAGAAERAGIAATFDALNLLLGRFVGELVGEIALNGFFAATGYALLRGGRRAVGTLGLAVAALGFLAALRNLTPAVAAVAEIDNAVLPIWLIVLGIVLAQRSTSAHR